MRFAVILVMLLPATTMAQTFDVNIKDSALWARYSAVAGELSFGKMEVDATGFIREGSRKAAGVGLHIVDNAHTAESPVYVGLGTRLIWVDSGADSGTVMAFGGYGRTTIPDADRVSVGAGFYIAPSVTSFGHARRYIEAGARAEYQLLEKGWLYGGYRRISARYAGTATRTIDNGLHLGMRFEF